MQRQLLGHWRRFNTCLRRRWFRSEAFHGPPKRSFSGLHGRHVLLYPACPRGSHGIERGLAVLANVHVLHEIGMFVSRQTRIQQLCQTILVGAGISCKH